MKMPVRLLSVVLALLLAFPGAAFAEIIFDDYTLEELIALKTQIHTEIIKRTIDDNSVRVPMGTYTVGVDIPAGAYMLMSGNDVAMITLYSSDGEIVTFHSLYYGDKVGKIEFQNGQKIEITFGSVVFSTYRGLGF